MQPIYGNNDLITDKYIYAGQQLSNPPRQTSRMRNKIKAVMLHPAPDEIVGHFGSAQLVRKPDGKHTLVGGAQREQSIVRNWCECFAPFIVFESNERIVLEEDNPFY
jgi:hypothetical protein